VTDVDPWMRQELQLKPNLDKYARMGLGVALFCLVLVDIITSLHPLPSVDIRIAAITMVSTCRFLCCAAKCSLKPRVKKYSSWMGLGIALFCLAFMDFIVPSVNILIMAIAMISVCIFICFAAKYDSMPRVKKWAKAALITLYLTFAITIIIIVISFAIYVAGRKESDTDLTITAYFSVVAIGVIVWVLIVWW